MRCGAAGGLLGCCGGPADARRRTKQKGLRQFFTPAHPHLLPPGRRNTVREGSLHCATSTLDRFNLYDQKPITVVAVPCPERGDVGHAQLEKGGPSRWRANEDLAFAGEEHVRARVHVPHMLGAIDQRAGLVHQHKVERPPLRENGFLRAITTSIHPSPSKSPIAMSFCCWSHCSHDLVWQVSPARQSAFTVHYFPETEPPAVTHSWHVSLNTPPRTAAGIAAEREAPMKKLVVAARTGRERMAHRRKQATAVKTVSAQCTLPTRPTGL